MSKLLALFLLVCLPLSWTTAAVAAYCNHETMPAEQQHLGHHQDSDHAPAAMPEPENQDAPNKPHAHCSLSHACCSVLPMSGVAIDDFLLPARLSWLFDARTLPSSLPDEPERPKWPIAV